jgi:hypothetical protein
VTELRKRTLGLPDDYLVVLVGDMVTEEALPTYMAMLNTLDGVRDETGASLTPWARWTREWTAEENRHGDVLNTYLYLTGRVNTRAVQVTVQNLIGSGMDPKTENNAYLGFVYTSFQERATKVSHGNTARHALEHGDDVLAKICGLVASDEGRHEMAYCRVRLCPPLFFFRPSSLALGGAGRGGRPRRRRDAAKLGGCGRAPSPRARLLFFFSLTHTSLRVSPPPPPPPPRTHKPTHTHPPNPPKPPQIVDYLFDKDPDGAVEAFADMMRKSIVMPAHLMDDGEHGAKNAGRNLFSDFSAVAESTGTYTAFDYSDIMEHLIKRWTIAERSFGSGEAAEAQEYLVKLPDRIRKLSERAAARRAKASHPKSNFSWVFDRTVQLK